MKNRILKDIDLGLKTSLMEKDVQRLPVFVKPKGTSIPGLTATLVQRTEKVAWYLRSDEYHEVFFIKTGMTFDGSGMTEYYPGTSDFGRTAICTHSEETAAQEYVNLCSGLTVNNRSATGGYSDTSTKKKRKIQRSQE